jgi:two-component system, sensor histidine kinase and response regulator
LRESRYRDLLSSTLIGIMVTDLNGQVTEANDTFLAMIRSTRRELETNLIQTSALATPEYAASAQSRREEFQATGRMGPLDREWQLKDGSRLNTLFFATKMEGTEGALCMVLDTNELQRTKAELRVVESRFKNMFDSNIVGLAIMNRALVFEEANEVYLALTGYSRDDLVAGRMTANALEVPELEHQYVEVSESLLKHGKIEPRETLYLRKDGTRIPVFRGVAHVDEAERYLIVAIDLSGEKATQAALGAAKQEAVSANQAKSEFLAHMSHEIRTPLNGVLGMLSLIMETSLSPEQQSYVRASRESGEHLLALINQVLDFSKIESGHLDLDTSEFTLEAIVEGAYSSVLGMAQKKGMEIVSKPDPDLPGRVIGDPVRLQQVLVNLIGNAVKFSEQGEICISSKLLAKGAGQCEILFEIADQGPGLSEGTRKRLFQPFRQGDTSLARKVGGTGLGLAISKDLVEKMGGRIWAENRLPQGSSFRFTVLLREGSGFREGAADGADGKRPVAWILEAQRGYLAPLAESLDRFGFETRAWADAEEMLRKLEAGLPSESRTLAILSIRPDGKGAEADFRILASARKAGVPVLCTLPFTAQSQSARLLAAGAAVILTKPFRNADIHAAIRAALPDWHGGEDANPGMDAVGVVPHGADWMQIPRILVVDDHPINLTVASAMLTRMGCAVETALDGASALSAASERHYDLVFMDCQMPIMDGFETTRKFRARENGVTRTPIIAFTAHAITGVKERCLAEGMDDYVSKPFTYEEMGAVVRKWVKPGLSWHPHGSREEADSPPEALAASIGAGVPAGAATWTKRPEAASRNSEPFVDWVRLDNLTDGTPAGMLMVRKLIRLFIDTTQSSLESIGRDLGGSSREACLRGLHKLKGGCGTIGARAMFKHLEAMEMETESGDPGNLRAMFVHLEGIFAETCESLEQLK